jgi:purine-binding chemotaxis protein CheW
MTDEENKKQIIVFTLGKETYGADINQVREIIKITDITPVPKAPPAVLGVIDLRGKIVPIIDLKEELALVKSPLADINLVIVTETTGKLVGLKVDAVNEVLKIENSAIEETPAVSISGDLKNAFFGMAKVDKKVIILVDLKKAIPNAEKIAS